MIKKIHAIAPEIEVSWDNPENVAPQINLTIWHSNRSSTKVGLTRKAAQALLDAIQEILDMDENS